MNSTPSGALPEDSSLGGPVEMHGESRDSSTFIQIGTQLIQPLPPSTLEVRYSLPPDTAAFTGRDDELSLVAATLTDSVGTGEVVAIDGMPGVGKTALAVRIAHLLRGRFPDRQLFINLHAHTPGQNPVRPQAALAGLLTAVGVDTRYLPGDLEGRTELWRDRMIHQRALLVLDNAATSAQVSPLLPGSEGCLVLVTSRRRLGDLPGVVLPVPLETLPPDEARVMFLRLTRRAGTDPVSAVLELVRLAGYLPLAISLLARVYARHPSWTLADLTNETEASLLSLAAEKDSIAAAFDVSYRYLSSSQQQFFHRLGLHPGTTIDAYAAAALVGISLQEAADQLNALYGEGLLSEVGYRRYGMHDLIRRYARDRAATEPAATRDERLEQLLDYYQHSAAAAEARLARQSWTRPTSVAAPGSAAIPDLPDRTTALSWMRTERANLLACLDHSSRTGQHGRVVALTAGMAALLREDGPLPDAVVRHTAAVQAAGHLGDRLGEADALTNLGIVLWLTDDFQVAASALEQALGIYRELGDRKGQANALSNLGAARWHAGDYPAAASALEEALATYRELDDRVGQANALSGLGGTCRMTGNYPSATLALEEALGIYRELGNRLGRANALSDLGSVQRMTGDYPAAATALEEALGIYRELGDREGEVEALNELGTLHRVRGNLDQAEACHQQSLDLAREIDSSWDEACALAGLGRCALAVGRTADAEAALRSAQKIFQRIHAAEAASVAAELDALTGANSVSKKAILHTDSDRGLCNHGLLSSQTEDIHVCPMRRTQSRMQRRQPITQAPETSGQITETYWPSTFIGGQRHGQVNVTLPPGATSKE